MRISRANDENANLKRKVQVVETTARSHAWSRNEIVGNWHFEANVKRLKNALEHEQQSSHAFHQFLLNEVVLGSGIF